MTHRFNVGDLAKLSDREGVYAVNLNTGVSVFYPFGQLVLITGYFEDKTKLYTRVSILIDGLPMWVFETDLAPLRKGCPARPRRKEPQQNLCNGGGDLV